MKKLKTKLLLSIIIILTLLFIFQISQNKISKYNKKTNVIYGTVIECNNNKNKTTLIVKGKEKILVNYYNKYNCKLGEKIEIKGKIKRPRNNTVFYQFNYKKFLLSKKIYYIFTANKITKINNKINLKYKIKNTIINHINNYKSKDYLKTFIIGSNQNLDNKIKNSYQKTGIIHLLSLSGMHITIITTYILKILNKYIKKEKISYLITIYILIFYLFITNFPPSLLRATLSYIILTINKIYNLKIKTIYIFLLVLLILLNINPYYIYNTGFILSFLVTYFLITYKKLIEKHKTYLEKILIITTISFLGSLPIIANSYFEINILSIFTNLLFVPLISIIVYPFSILTFFIKPLDPIYYKLTNIIELLSTKIEKINILTFNIKHLSISEIIIYFLIINIILKIKETKDKNYVWVIFIIIIIYHNINIFNPNNIITAIDVGQGDSILIKLRHNKSNILIDTGGNTNNKENNKISKNTISYLKSEGINKLNYLILTHGDLDHCGEAINLVNNFKVEKVIFNCGAYNNLEKELIKVLDKKKIKYYSCIKELNIDKNKLHFLQTKEYDNENDNSNVIYTELNGYKFLFMGDASSTTEKEILDKYNLPGIDVLKVGHHGSKTSSGKEFINEINPKYSIISVGKNNRYGHPNKEALDNLKDSKIYRTDEDGSIMFKIKNNKLKVETCAP